MGMFKVQPYSIDKILIDLGLDKLFKDEQKKYRKRIEDALAKRFFLETVMRLDAKEAQKYRKIVERGSSARELDDFFEENNINSFDIAKKVIDDYEQEVVNAVDPSLNKKKL